jgi:hypothetical protein
MNLVGDIAEVTSDQCTPSYVYELKKTLKTKHEESLILQKTNSKLTQKIIELQEQLKLTESQRDFEILKSNLLLASQQRGSSSSSNPNDIVQIVSSWFPSHVDASVACCIKAEDSWIVVEEKLECQRIPFSSLLDEVVLCCALSDDGFSGTELIPESILRSLGWSPLHKSVAITVYSGCVWVIIGINFQDIRLLIPGLNSLLHISTELIISRVMNLLQETETSHHLSRVECSLEIWKLLLQPTCELESRHYHSPPLTSKRKKRERKDHLSSEAHQLLPSESVVSDSASLPIDESMHKESILSLDIPIRTVDPDNISLCEHIFQSISKRMEKSIEGMECEVLLFCEQIQTHYSAASPTAAADATDSAAWIISSTRGVSRRNMETMPFSLTEKTIFDQEELYVRETADTNNDSALNLWIDCGNVDASADEGLVEEIPAFAISPLWKDITFRSAPGGGEGVNIHGALVYRIKRRRFTESELNLLQCISKDNIPIIKQWIENNLQNILKLNHIPTQFSNTPEMLESVMPDPVMVSDLPMVSVPSPDQVMSQFSDSLQQLVCSLQSPVSVPSSQMSISRDRSQLRLQQMMSSLLEISLKSLSSSSPSKTWAVQDAGVYLRSPQGSPGKLSRERSLDQPQFLSASSLRESKLPEHWDCNSSHRCHHIASHSGVSSNFQNLLLLSSEEFQQIHPNRHTEEETQHLSVLEIFIHDSPVSDSVFSHLSAHSPLTLPSSVIASILISLEHFSSDLCESQSNSELSLFLLELNSFAFLTQSLFKYEQTLLESVITPLSQQLNQQHLSEIETVRTISQTVLHDTVEGLQGLLSPQEAMKKSFITSKNSHSQKEMASGQQSVEVISQEWKDYKDVIEQVQSLLSLPPSLPPPPDPHPLRRSRILPMFVNS